MSAADCKAARRRLQLKNKAPRKRFDKRAPVTSNGYSKPVKSGKKK